MPCAVSRTRKLPSLLMCIGSKLENHRQPQACSWSVKLVHEGREDPGVTSWRRARKLPRWSCSRRKAVHGVFLHSRVQSHSLLKCHLDFLPEEEMGFWDAVQPERRWGRGGDIRHFTSPAAAQCTMPPCLYCISAEVVPKRAASWMWLPCAKCQAPKHSREMWPLPEGRGRDVAPWPSPPQCLSELNSLRWDWGTGRSACTTSEQLEAHFHHVDHSSRWLLVGLEFKY